MSREKDAAKEAGGFASRWSRLKRETRAPVPEEAPATETAPDAPAEDTRTDAEVLEQLGLPDPDALKPGDDFAVFMAKAVPARIRNRALRRLWLSDPVLANVDMLVDYGDDFTDAATVVENLQTAYQVGKGFVDRVSEIAGDTPADDSGAAPEEEAAEPPRQAAEEAAGDTPGDPGAGDQASPEPETLAEPATAERKPRLRPRMRFRVAEE